MAAAHFASRTLERHLRRARLRHHGLRAGRCGRPRARAVHARALHRARRRRCNGSNRQCWNKSSATTRSARCSAGSLARSTLALDSRPAGARLSRSTLAPSWALSRRRCDKLGSERDDDALRRKIHPKRCGRVRETPDVEGASPTRERRHTPSWCAPPRAACQAAGLPESGPSFRASLPGNASDLG